MRPVRVKSIGRRMFLLNPRKDTSRFCSDDDTVYPKPPINASSSFSQSNNAPWSFVQPGHDQRSKPLSGFRENVGPTFPIGSSPSPSVFHNQMLPDSLFDYIVMCTNTRARVYFDGTVSSSQSREAWKSVSLFQGDRKTADSIRLGLAE